MTETYLHAFKGVVGSNEQPRLYRAKCGCGQTSNATLDKGDAYGAYVDHLFEQPEVQVELVKLFARLPEVAGPCISIPLDRPERVKIPIIPGSPEQCESHLPTRPARPRPSLDHPSTGHLPPMAPETPRFVPMAWVVGSLSDCDWVINGDQYVSGRHCLITRTISGHYTVEDIGSTNGTWIRRQAPHGASTFRIARPITLLAGDEVIIGKTVLGSPPEYELGKNNPVS